MLRKINFLANFTARWIDVLFLLTLALLSETKWTIHREIIVPLQCRYLDLCDVINDKLALWQLVANELYCTVPYHLKPQISPEWAY